MAAAACPRPTSTPRTSSRSTCRTPPGNYTNLPRPIPAADASEIGMLDNGLNCGRWVQVTIGNYCTGINDGAPNEPFCRNGSWVSDAYNGATLDFVVADSCDDGKRLVQRRSVPRRPADPSPGAWLRTAVTRCCPGYLVLSRERPIRYLNCHSGFPVQAGPAAAGHCISETFPRGAFTDWRVNLQMTEVPARAGKVMSRPPPPAHVYRRNVTAIRCRMKADSSTQLLCVSAPGGVLPHGQQVLMIMSTCSS